MDFDFHLDWQEQLSRSYLSINNARLAEFKNLNLCFGVCRSGTTALAQVFGKAGFNSYYQPIKADVRQALLGEQVQNLPRVLSDLTKPIFIKETFGPMFAVECAIDYLEFYKAVGISSANINIIFTARNPENTFASWLVQWGGKRSRKDLFDNFILANRSLTLLENRLITAGHDISYTCLELSNIDHFILERIFASASPNMVFDPTWLVWDDLKNHRDEKSAIKFPIEPDFFAIRDIHENPGHWGENAQSSAKRRAIELCQSEIEKFESEGLYSAYRRRANLTQYFQHQH